MIRRAHRRPVCDPRRAAAVAWTAPHILTKALEELSEEDQQLKSDLDMLAERILVGSPSKTRTRFALIESAT
jgi:hypothetical protein